MNGKIATLVPHRGFGFIRGEDGKEYFFHLSALQGVRFEELTEGQDVEFGPQEQSTGDRAGERPRAVSVRLAESAVPAVDNEPIPAEKIGT
jgi:CspA family cold shock protein